MSIMLVFLILGIIIGFFDILPEKFIDKFKTIPYASLIFILFLMGSKIGMDPKIIQNFKIIGYKAFMIAIGSIIGSLGFIKLFLGRVSFSMERQEENR